MWKQIEKEPEQQFKQLSTTVIQVRHRSYLKSNQKEQKEQRLVERKEEGKLLSK